MQFQYSAKSRAGATTAGQIEAESLVDARRKLRGQGLFPLAIDSGASRARSSVKGAGANTAGWSRVVSRSDLVHFASQWTIMCQSGVDVAKALEDLAAQWRPGPMKDAIVRVHADVSAGKSVSEAMREHPRVFDATFTASVAAGERSGELIAALERLTSLLRSDMRLVGSLWALATYPLLLCGVTALVIVGIVFFVLPQFSQVFANMDAPVPPVTAALLATGEFARSNAIAIAVAMVVVVAGMAYFRQTPLASQIWDHIILDAPLVRGAFRSLVAGRVFRLLGAMLQCGVPLLECIRLGRDAVSNGVFRRLFDEIERELLRGHAMSGPLIAARFLPQGVAQMIATGERSGRLAQVLQSVGEHFEDEGESRLRDLVKIFEPAVIIALGIVVAGVVMSVMLPLFDATTMVR